MAASVVVQARIDAEVKEQATTVLSAMGLTVSDVVRIVLTRVANEGSLPPGLVTDPQAHDAWFRARVQEALDDPRPAIPHEDVEAHMARRRSALLQRLEGRDA